MSEQSSLWSTLTFLRALRKHADLVNTSMAAGLALSGIVLMYLPLSGLYVALTAPSVVLFFVLGFGALARSLVAKKRRRRRRRTRSRSASRIVLGE